MLTVLQGRHRFCDGQSRRSFLRIGAAGVAGLGLADLLRADTATGAPPRSVINIYLGGGPTHMDTFDLKPDAPKEFRGDFRPIATSVPGMEICELMPQLAAQGERFALIRSITGLRDEHSPRQSDSGWSEQDLRSMGGRPGVGAVLSRVLGPAQYTAEGTAPTSVDLSGFTNSGFLGQVHDAYRPDGAGRSNLTLSGNMNADRFLERRRLLGDFDRYRREVDGRQIMTAMDSFADRAVGIVTSGKIYEALDLEKEPKESQERYGVKLDNECRNLILARRLIAAGVRSVSLSINGWDTHSDNFNAMRRKLPALDAGLSSLLTDLAQSGLLERTIVLMSGEFGRTPRINGGAGRDHWSYANFFFVAGGGFRTGQVIGSTNRLGERPEDRPIHVQRVFSTVYHQLGIDPGAITLTDPNGRPQYLVDHRERVTELG
jgi:hypothetical protein